MVAKTMSKDGVLLIYSEKKALVKRLNDEISNMEPDVSKIVSEKLEKSGEKTLSNDFGSFKITTKKAITYSEEYNEYADMKTKEIEEIDQKIKPLSDEIKVIQNGMKEKQEAEVEEGIAKVEIISKSAVFTVKKADKEE